LIREYIETGHDHGKPLGLFGSLDCPQFRRLSIEVNKTKHVRFNDRASICPYPLNNVDIVIDKNYDNYNIVNKIEW